MKFDWVGRSLYNGRKRYKQSKACVICQSYRIKDLIAYKCPICNVTICRDGTWFKDGDEGRFCFFKFHGMHDDSSD